MSGDQMRELLDRAKGGRLAPEELDDVVTGVERVRENGDADLYTLLNILGHASSAEAHADTVAPFVEYRDDPMVAALALKILGLWWGRAGDWLPVLRRALQGQEWDEDDEVRLAACTVSGEYLRHGSDPALLRSLVAAAAEEAADPVVRKYAREQLARALGHTHREILGMDSGLPSFERLVEAAEERLRGEEGVPRRS